MNHAILDAERAHLSNLLEAIQRCVFFLEASKQKLTWPLQAEEIRERRVCHGKYKRGCVRLSLQSWYLVP